MKFQFHSESCLLVVAGESGVWPNNLTGNCLSLHKELHLNDYMKGIGSSKLGFPARK